MPKFLHRVAILFVAAVLVTSCSSENTALLPTEPIEEVPHDAAVALLTDITDRFSHLEYSFKDETGTVRRSPSTECRTSFTGCTKMDEVALAPFYALRNQKLITGSSRETNSKYGFAVYHFTVSTPTISYLENSVSKKEFDFTISIDSSSPDNVSISVLADSLPEVRLAEAS